jgi:hypothetical protein
VKLQVELDLLEDDIFTLAGHSNLLREDPTKRWRLPEKKEHARAAIQHIVFAWLKQKNQVIK